MTRTPAVMEIELKPCPFCGSDAIMMRDDGSCYKVQCSEAWCFAERACWRQTERAAIKDWNTRTPAEPLADGEIIEKLVREAYEEGVEDGMERGFDPTDGAPQWIDSVARIETLRAIAAAYNPNDRLREALEEAWTDFLDANPDDLNSPEEYPDHALVTFKQLVGIVDAALSHKD